jgi:uncharacterized membrane protein
MRRIAEIVSLAALAAIYWITYEALAGPGRLHDQVPTHFNLAGKPDAWGPPSMLLLLPIMATGLYLMMSLVSRFPSAFNYPVRVTAENRERLQTLALTMIGWLKAETMCLFAWIQWISIQVVRLQGKGFPAVAMPITAVVIFGTLVWFIVAMRKTAKARTA